MKKFFIYGLLLLVSLAASAQTQNMIMIPDVSTSIGQAQLPVSINNDDEIVAVQFDLTLPDGITAGQNVTLTNRANGHTAIARSLSSGAYRVVLYATPTTPLLGQSGTVMNIPITIPTTCAEGSEHQLSISNAVLTKASGENVLTEATAGRITISKVPNLTVKSISADKTTLTPGERFVASWQVENVGSIATSNGWSEQVILVSEDGSFNKLIATTYYEETLSAGGIVSRQAEIELPYLLGIEGQAHLQVKIVPYESTGEPVSAQGDNTGNSDALYNINKVLTLEFSPSSIVENSNTRIAAKLSRSGNWSKAETFTISTTNDSRVSVPTSVTIPAKQSGKVFYITVSDNNVLDENSHVALTIEGNGYPTLTKEFTIEDNEYPDLNVTASKSVVAEGETFQLTITTSRVSDTPIEVTINSENSSRFNFPSKAILPAGQESVVVNVEVVNDDVPSVELSTAFTVSADKYNKAEVIILLQDDDMPVLELILTPNQVSESAGVVSVAGVLRRTTNKDSKITVKLTDDADGGLYFGNRTLELAKGVDEVHFNFGPVDNAEVDGDRTYTITAAVWLSSCSCSAGGESAGAVTAQLKVLDDDGPSLTVTSSQSTVKEGGSTTLTITRNTSTENTLTVNVSSDYDDNLTYNHTVTIPAGQKSVTIEVASLSNDVSGDSHTVIFTAQAQGFNSGTCYIMVTDQTLPDARISSLTADKTEEVVGGNAKFTIVVINDGAANLPKSTQIKLYRRGESSAIASLYTSKILAIGETETLEREVILPNVIGKNTYFAVINETNEINELSFTNNTSEDFAIQTTSPFSVTVQSDKSIYSQGESVNISGQISGRDVAGAKVEIYVINDGVRQTIDATTDSQGAFSTSWTPYALQSGHFVLGACYPGENSEEEMASFDIYGLRRTDYSYVKCDVTLGDTYTGNISLFNPGVLDLTNVKVETISAPDNCVANLQIPTTIAGGESSQITYSLQGTEPTAENKWDEIKAKVTTAQGVSLDITIYFYCRNAQAKLAASTQTIKTTMTKGQPREYSFDITNQGKGNSGKITLALPEWIQSLSGNTLPALEQNDNITVALRFVPTDDMQLNVPVTGQLGINCENGDGTFVQFNITPVSEEKGVLTVDVCDEYTYYTAEAPHVEGAQVVVSSPTTNALVAQGLTNTDGRFSIELPEGYYKLSVTADNHDSYTNYIFVDPGVETVKNVNLSVQAITVSWNVEETEVEDEYEINTIVSYETNVPMPVVELNVPSKIDADLLAVGESLIFNAILTNKGLIAAQDAELLLPEGFKHLTFEPLIPYSGLTIAPQQSIIIPVKVTRVSIPNYIQKKVKPLDDDPCAAEPGTLYFWDCGTDRKWHRYGVALQVGSCRDGETPSGGGGGSGTPISPNFPSWDIVTGGPSSPNPGGGNNYTTNTSDNNVTPNEDKGCEPCQNQFLIDLVDCGLQLVPAYRVLKAVVACGSSLMKTYKVLNDDSASLAKRAGAITEALSTCLAARHAGSGDKNATRAQQREEAIESILETLGTITGQIGQGEIEDVTSWDGIVETIGSLASSISSLAGFDYDNLEEMFCPLKLFKPCDKEPSPSKEIKKKTDTSINGGYPSYLVDFRRALSYGLADMMAIKGMMVEVYGDMKWLDVEGSQLSEFYKELILLQDVNGIVDESCLDRLVLVAPEGIDTDDISAFIDRWNNTITEATSENKIDVDKVYEYYHIIEVSEQELAKTGYDDLEQCMEKEYTIAKERLEEANGTVCSSIKLEISQKMVTTRQAFRGTLTVFNGHETEAMENAKLHLTVTSEMGEVATAHEFQINLETLKEFQGNLDLESGWTLAANTEGTATILFIPTKYAAPTTPVNYSFGGTLSYVDPFTGLEVTRELYPVTLTVNPSPELDLTYFMQRDIYGDDPLTEEVEAMVPGEFALLINNKGYGDATNVRMITRQPEIIENEKGLLIDLNILSSQINGEDALLSFGQTIANNFGAIPAHSQAYAQWWLQSSLLGHFTEYDVTATHVTSYGNEDLSLLDQVTIHELIHGFTYKPQSGSNLRGFLVNDIADAEDMPDEIYFTNATQNDVTIANGATISKNNDMEYMLTVNAGQTGWNYGSLLDPTIGKQKLVSIIRQSDGAEIPVDNIWQTDRTLRDGKDWLYENRLHFVADIHGTTETYLLTFEPKPEVELEVESYEGLPEDGSVKLGQLTELTVKFNKPINAETFTTADITLKCQGTAVDVTPIVIEKINDQEFKLTLNEVTISDGYYVLTVQTAGIEDNEGFNGSTGKQASWIQFIDGKVALKVAASPIEGGSVTPSSGRFDYDSSVTLNATPAEGYEFSRWMWGNDVVSDSPEFNYQLNGDAELTAYFTLKNYNVTVDYDAAMGSVKNGATGIYVHGTKLKLIALPNEDYKLEGWKVNGELISEDFEHEFEITKAMVIEAVFTKRTLDLNLALTMPQGWSWISSSFVKEDLRNAKTFLDPIKEQVSRLVGFEDELTNDPTYGLVGNMTSIKPENSYKLYVNGPVSLNYSGEAEDPEFYTITLQKGWNWIGYLPVKALPVSEALMKHLPMENDVVKTQDAFATYYDGAWTGTLTEMKPGEGYMYFSGRLASFNYPKVYPEDNRPTLAPRADGSEDETPWIYDAHQYPDNSTLIGRLYVNEQYDEEGNFIVGAFCGDECRGVGKNINGYVFLTIHGSLSEEQTITFRAYDVNTEAEYDISERINFAGENIGTMGTPMELHVSGTTRISAIKAGLSISPRPVRTKLYINGDTEQIKSVRILAANGRKVLETSGYEQNGIDVGSLLPAMYVVVIECNDGHVYYDKVFKK